MGSSNKYLLIILIILTLFTLSNTKSKRKRNRKPKKQKNCYEKFGIATDSSERQIKKAFRKLAMKYHPDKVKEADREESENKFKELAHCYEILSDKDQRQKYDASGYNEQFDSNSPGAHNFKFEGNFEDIFSNFFGKGNQFGFDNLFGQNGGNQGFGFNVGGKHGGFGKNERQQNVYNQQQKNAKKVYIALKDLMKDSVVSVDGIRLKIPKGCPDGHVIVENGLQFAIYSKSNSDFYRGTKSHKSDLYTHYNVNLDEALLGFNLKIMDIDNELIEVWMDNVPHSREYQVKRKGLPRFGGSTRGHLYITFDVQLPTLNKMERNNLKEYLQTNGDWNYSEAKKYRKKQKDRKNRRDKQKKEL